MKFVTSHTLLAAALTLTACVHGTTTRVRGLPAPADSTDTRAWKAVQVNTAYGTFEMNVPTLVVTANSNERETFVIDSIALREVEHRMTARIAKIAREEAAALKDKQPVTSESKNRAAVIKPDLLGTIEFEKDGALLREPAVERFRAIARLAEMQGGSLEVVSTVEGSGAATFDAALARARQVYLALVETDPKLAERSVQLTVRMQPVLTGAARNALSVDVFLRTQQ